MNRTMRLLLVSIFTILLIGLFPFTTLANDQSTIRTNVLTDMYGIINATFEKPIDDKITLYICGEYFSFRNNFYRINGGLNYYFNEANNGLYIGGGASCWHSNSDCLSYNFSAKFGYGMIYNNKFVINFSIDSLDGSILGIGFAF